MTKEEAIAKYESKWWVGKTAQDIVQFQLYEQKLCTDFSVFHGAVEECLGRPVFTHEFGLNLDGIKAEFDLLPSEKTIIVEME